MSLLCSNVQSQEIKTKKKGGKIGFFAGKEQIIEPKYDKVDHKIEGFYQVWIDDKIGIVSESGLEIIPCNYESISGFPQNGFIVEKDGLQGVFNSEGDIVLDIEYDEIQYYRDTVALIKYQGRWCNLIDGEYNYDIDQLIFKKPDKMPLFPGCYNINLSYEAMKQCSDQKMIEFIFKNIKYPPDAVKNRIQGIVIVSFIVTREGVLKNPKVIREIGGGCGAEAVSLVKTMPTWIPGEHDDQVVNTEFFLPIKFTLK